MIGDCYKLYRDWGISMRNCVDLSLFARSVDNATWKGRYANPIGLARLVETYEHLSLPKGKVQRSNWEAAPLSLLQQDCTCDHLTLQILAHSYNYCSQMLQMMRTPD